MSRFYSFWDTDKIQPVVEEEMATENNKTASGIRTADFFFLISTLVKFCQSFSLSKHIFYFLFTFTFSQTKTIT